MNATTLQVILIVVAVIAMLEAVWVLAAPESYKKFAGFWVSAAAKVPTLLPIVLAVIGILIWAIVIMQQPIYHTLGILIGLLFILGAVLYSDVEAMKRVTDRFLLERSTRTLRLMGVGILIVAALVLLIAVSGR